MLVSESNYQYLDSPQRKMVFPLPFNFLLYLRLGKPTFAYYAEWHLQVNLFHYLLFPQWKHEGKIHPHLDMFLILYRQAHSGWWVKCYVLRETRRFLFFCEIVFYISKTTRDLKLIIEHPLMMITFLNQEIFAIDNRKIIG